MRRLSLVCAFATMATGASAMGGIINYGDFAGNTVDYLDVTEFSDSDPEPLFGAPNVIDDSLFFNNLTFAALAKGAGGSDKTRGILTTNISARDGEAIRGLSFRESGSYTLAGFGNDAAAAVSAQYHINVLEIDGVPVSPLDFDMQMSFDPSNGDFTLSDDGPGSDLWEGLLDLNLDALLASRGRSGSATLVSVIITNSLSAISQEDTLASIAKKTLTVNVVPAPPTALLLLLGAGSGRRRRRDA